jgi:hypothetical protein
MQNQDSESQELICPMHITAPAKQGVKLQNEHNPNATRKVCMKLHHPVWYNFC